MAMIKNALKNVLFPGKCLECGSFLNSEGVPSRGFRWAAVSAGFAREGEGTHFRFLTAGFLCPTCLSGAVPVTSPFCTTCGIPFKSRSGDNHTCGSCIEGSHKFRMARASAVYQKAFMKLIHYFKYMGKTQLAKPFSMILLETFIRFWREEKIDLLMPVPLHPKRFRKRGFNQAYLLIRGWPALADALHLELPCSRIERRILVRNRHTQTQTGLGRKMRRENIKGAFGVANRHEIKDKKVLLVDDVLTTGATANECAGVLLKHGALSVDVLTLACALSV